MNRVNNEQPESTHPGRPTPRETLTQGGPTPRETLTQGGPHPERPSPRKAVTQGGGVRAQVVAIRRGNPLSNISLERSWAGVGWGVGGTGMEK